MECQLWFVTVKTLHEKPILILGLLAGFVYYNFLELPESL